MADKHPYMSGSGGVTQIVAQLRKSFPATVTAETLKKLGISPNNETYVLNILKFVGVLDGENKKAPAAVPVFNKHDSAEFQEGFAKLVRSSYQELFDLHGDDAWGLAVDKLISFFRNHDGTSDIVGKRQATTFQTLARIGGKLAETSTSPAKPAVNGVAKIVKKASAKKTAAQPVATPVPDKVAMPAPHASPHENAGSAAGVGLTVRIEINLPPGGDQATYDAIFRSIRENLLNGNSA